jgi:hypothetical protein
MLVLPIRLFLMRREQAGRQMEKKDYVVVTHISCDVTDEHRTPVAVSSNKREGFRAKRNQRLGASFCF